MTDLVEPRTADITYETDQPVLYEAEGPIAWITLNRPAFNNAPVSYTHLTLPTN